MTDAPAPRLFVVVYQFGKVASTALVSALDAMPGVEAVQSHFLGEAALQQMLTATISPALTDYFFRHQSGQLMANLGITRRIARILAGHEPQTRLAVVTTVREPMDWLRSAITQDAAGYEELVTAIRARRGEEDCSVADAYAEILGQVATTIEGFGSLEALLANRRASMTRIRASVRNSVMAELYSTVIRPFTWHPLMFEPVFDCRMDDFTGTGPLRILRRPRFDAFLFRYEDARAVLPALGAELGLPQTIRLPAANLSDGKRHGAEIREAFQSDAASRLAALFSATDYARRYGYGGALSAAGWLAREEPSGTPPSAADGEDTGLRSLQADDPPATRAPDPDGGSPAVAAVSRPARLPTLPAVLLCPVCRAAALGPTAPGGLACSACGNRVPVTEGMLDLRRSADADTALDDESYDRRHDVTAQKALPLFRVYAGALADHGRGPVGRVLELGAGTGNLTVGLAAHGQFDELHITDLSPRFMRRLRAKLADLGRGPAPHVYLLDANSLPFADESFDAVFGHSVLHHLLDFESTLADTLRILKPGGVAMFGEPMMDTHGLVYTLAGQILALSEAGTGPELTPRIRTILRAVAGHATIKGGNLARRDDETARYEDKYVFPADFLRSLSARLGFRRFELRQAMPLNDYGALLQRILEQVLVQAGADPAEIAAYLPLFRPFSTVLGVGMRGHLVGPFAHPVFVK